MMVHSKEWLYLKYADSRSLYPCHNGESCSKSITYDDWHCHECQHQGKSEMDEKLYGIEMSQKGLYPVFLHHGKGGAA